MTSYDIIYSLTVHEYPDVINDTLRNIKKYNINNKILIILHANINIYKTFIPDNDIKDITLINPKPYDKNLFTMSLLKAHFDNYEYLIQKGIQFKFMMLLASNCMFCKQMPKMTNVEPLRITTQRYTKAMHKNNDADWPPFYCNKKIFRILRNNDVGITKSQHEGCVLSWDLAECMNKYLRINNVFNLVEKETQFEEILLPSLEIYFQGSIGYRYCKVYWENPGYMATRNDISEIINSNNNVCVVKRVPRDLNSDIRKFINNEIICNVVEK
jgi:hypothetical protein